MVYITHKEWHEKVSLLSPILQQLYDHDNVKFELSLFILQVCEAEMSENGNSSLLKKNKPVTHKIDNYIGQKMSTFVTVQEFE